MSTTATTKPRTRSRKAEAKPTADPFDGLPNADDTKNAPVGAKAESDGQEPKVPAPSKRDAKQVLARSVVDAVAYYLATTGLSGDITRAMSKEDAEQTVAQWLHHLPTGKDGDKRYWPESMPRPDRSDWK